MIEDKLTYTQVLAEMRAEGVVELRIGYNGSGDEGFIEEFETRDKNDNGASVNEERRKVLETWAYDQLEDQYSGWEINEGSFGGFAIQVESGKVKHIHNTRYERYDTDERDW